MILTIKAITDAITHVITNVITKVITVIEKKPKHNRNDDNHHKNSEKRRSGGQSTSRLTVPHFSTDVVYDYPSHSRRFKSLLFFSRVVYSIHRNEIELRVALPRPRGSFALFYSRVFTFFIVQWKDAR